MSSFAEFLRVRQAEVETHLREALRPETGLPESLLEAMRYSLLAPGKRLRPILVALAAEACGDRWADPWPASCAVEMIHVYSLIHDDLPAMDDDDLRRGQPTCHKRFGEALAILAGDALQSLAFQTLAERYPPATGVACCAVLAKAAGGSGMVGGQVDDLTWEGKVQGRGGERSLDGLEALHVRKTGALIQASLRLGVLAGHVGGPAPTPELLDRFDGYGRRLGLAFQIVDDLLDVEGNADQAGKRVGKDAGRNKLTYPGLLGVDESRRRAARLCQEARDGLEPIGPAADRLRELATYVLERDR